MTPGGAPEFYQPPRKQWRLQQPPRKWDPQVGMLHAARKPLLSTKKATYTFTLRAKKNIETQV